MAQFVKLNPETLTELRTVNERLISYNVEMTEVTGGTFWKAYTDAQIDGTEDVPPPDFTKVWRLCTNGMTPLTQQTHVL